MSKAEQTVTVNITRGTYVSDKWYSGADKIVTKSVADELVKQGAATIDEPEPTTGKAPPAPSA